MLCGGVAECCHTTAWGDGRWVKLTVVGIFGIEPSGSDIFFFS